MAMTPLLSVKNLEVIFPLRSGPVTAIRDVSFDLSKGERIGIVGESGAGKSISAFAILNLISKPGFLSRGRIDFDGVNLAEAGEDTLRGIRGNRISMIFQDPMMTLNPVLTIGTQIEETVLAHKAVSREEARSIALSKLEAVRIPSARTRLQQYPHQLSGGMRQRVVIAIALATEPQLIIADEPTTALDVTIQAEILDLILQLCLDSDMSLILISHDLGVVYQVTQRILVMYAGSIIEQGLTPEIIHRPAHPYTRGLIDALPEMTKPGARLNQIPGVMPSLDTIPSGCPFHDRCQFTQEICATEFPASRGREQHTVACHFPLGFD
mgnify:CR=1 FL=1